MVDVLAVAQVAGIMAAKNTYQNVVMCHPIPILGCDIRKDNIKITAIAK